MAGDEMFPCAVRFRRQLRLSFRADRLRQWTARSEAATGERLDRIGNVPAQDDLPAAARYRFRNRWQSAGFGSLPARAEVRSRRAKFLSTIQSAASPRPKTWATPLLSCAPTRQAWSRGSRWKSTVAAAS